jgi:serine/threonine protein phosphatase PrpC
MALHCVAFPRFNREDHHERGFRQASQTRLSAMSRLSIKVAGLTDKGKARLNNEDAVCIDANLGLLIVADGMGGHQSGEVASRMAVSSIHTHLAQLVQSGTAVETTAPRLSIDTNRLGFCFKVANESIFTAAPRDSQERGMGTTCTAALISNGILSIAHIGDSRCYLIRNGVLEQLTQDHSLVMEQVRQGLISKDDEIVKTHQNILTRSLGTEPEVMVDLEERPLFEGDVLLLCSDGLDKEVTEDQLLQTAQETSEPEDLVRRLIDMANAAGGRDNITVAVARIDTSGLGASIKNFLDRITS